jgi:elongation factor G
MQESQAALAGCDAAIVVCEPDEKKTAALQLILKEIDKLKIPRFLFINKIDKSDNKLMEVLSYLQPASSTPLVLRQVPIWNGSIATGFVDLALERAFVYREHGPSEVIEMPSDIKDHEKEARFKMLEKLADYDDELMEQLLSDMEPPRDRVFADLASDLQRGLITPVLFGSAENGNGILRLLKALRHEAPSIEDTRKRLGVGANGAAVAQTLKTFHTAHGGKLTIARVLSGTISEGQILSGARGQESRVAGVFQMMGSEPKKIQSAKAGDMVALGRLEHIGTGETISSAKGAPQQAFKLTVNPPVYGFAISVPDRKDEVKLTAAVGKLIEEDPSLSLQHNQDTHEMVLWGQGEMHLRVALERLRGRFGVNVNQRTPAVGYRETIRKSATQRGRHKKQSGGHGQFGDVVLEVKALPRGEGFKFDERVVGGAVPRNYIPAVEEGVRDALAHGPLGFPVVDIAVTLTDGSYHTVDSSDLAFRTAARIGVSEALPGCQPVLLEPIHTVEIVCPTDATAKINAILSGRRGQILSFDTREGWPGWDMVRAMLPEAEIGDLIIEVRSATTGAGSFTTKFDHMAEVTGRTADQIVAAHRAAA